MRKLTVIFFACRMLISVCAAQETHKYWSIGINPLSPAESMSSIGPCAAYRISSRMELWGELSFIFYNLYKIGDWENLRGYRFVFQPRYYLGNSKTFFITPELRYKQYSYNSTLTFTNSTSTDTLKNYSHKSTQYLIGGALVLGKQLVLSERRKLYLEITAGIGGKQRYIKRKNIPTGYKYEVILGGFGLQPHYQWDNDGTPYFPLGFRLIWKLPTKN